MRKERKMDGAKFASSFIAAIEARQQHGELVVTLGLLKRLVHEAINPETATSFERPPVPPQLPTEPEYPRLKVKYDRGTGRPLEYRVIYNINEELPTMSAPWYRRPLAEVDEVRRQICAD
jgi:hypothetical protein